MNEEFEFYVKKLIRGINYYLFSVIGAAVAIVIYALTLLAGNDNFSMHLFVCGIIGFVLFLVYFLLSNVKSRYLYMLEHYQNDYQEVLHILRSHIITNQGSHNKKHLTNYENAYNALLHRNKIYD